MVGCGVRYPNPKIKVVTMARLIYRKLGAYLVLIKYTYLEIIRRVRKISNSNCYLRHVSPSVRMEQLGSHWKDFHEILYLNVLSENFRENFIFERFSANCREKLSPGFCPPLFTSCTNRSSVYFRNVGINLPTTQK
jgi:hypothetical protein